MLPALPLLHNLSTNIIYAYFYHTTDDWSRCRMCRSRGFDCKIARSKYCANACVMTDCGGSRLMDRSGTRGSARISHLSSECAHKDATCIIVSQILSNLSFIRIIANYLFSHACIGTGKFEALRVAVHFLNAFSLRTPRFSWFSLMFVLARFGYSHQL